MEVLIDNGEQLKEWFFAVRKRYDVQKLWDKGIFVNSKVRKDILIDVSQGKTIIEGRVRQIKFENVGGGVYRAYLSD